MSAAGYLNRPPVQRAVRIAERQMPSVRNIVRVSCLRLVHYDYQLSPEISVLKRTKMRMISS